MKNEGSDFESRGFTDSNKADYTSVQCVVEKRRIGPDGGRPGPVGSRLSEAHIESAPG